MTDRNEISERADVVVIGGGVVGCAVAAALARAKRQVLVLERESALGTGISSRNSGVIHSGIYYKPGSLKAQCCVRGNRLLYEWARAHDVWHARVGKLVIVPAGDGGTAHDELMKLWAVAEAAGAPDVALLSAAGVAAREPTLKTAGAMWCGATGIVDVHELILSLRAAAERDGAIFVVNAAVNEIDAADDGVRLSTSRGDLRADHVINAAGMASDELAARAGVVGHRHHPCRGDYFRLRTSVPYRHLIYPVRDHKAPGLGVHLTLERGGGMRLGPDSVYVADRNDCSSGAHKLEAFLVGARQLLGEPITADQLQYDSCGIRPKLRAPNDSEEKDFAIVRSPAAMVHLIGIESPGLTAALAIAERVAAMVA